MPRRRSSRNSSVRVSWVSDQAPEGVSAQAATQQQMASFSMLMIQKRGSSRPEKCGLAQGDRKAISRTSSKSTSGATQNST